MNQNFTESSNENEITNGTSNELDTTNSLDEFLTEKWNDLKEITNRIGSYISKRFKDLNQLNIIIMGKSGVGKSTLINKVFRDNLATTGIGQPVTQKINKLTKKNVPLTIYDTPGLELDSNQQKSLEDGIFNLIENQAAKNNFNYAIHCIWYCINCESKRFEPTEVEFIKKFTEDSRLGKIPVIIVLTQSYDEDVREQMIAEINKMNLNVKQIVPVVSKEKTFKMLGNTFSIPQYGLDTLIEVVENCLPEILKDTLQNVQIVSMNLKRKTAKKIIASSIAAAGTAAASPIPFSDCMILVPIEIAMLTSITLVYGVELSSGFIANFLSCTIGCGTASLLGKMAVVNLMKFIPCVGTALAGFVSGGTASIITSALGAAYIAIIERIYNGEFNYESITREDFKEQVQASFKEQLSLTNH